MATLTQLIQFTLPIIGEAVRHIGDKQTPTDLTVSGQVWDSGNFPVADAYTAATIWNGGDGGLTSFSYLIFIADSDMWLEFANTVPATDENALVFVPAGAMLVLPSAYMGGYANNTSRLDGAVLVAATDYNAINKIRVQNNVAAGAGTATCRLVLIK